MGKHFDTLVDVIKNQLPETEQAPVPSSRGDQGLLNVKAYLARLVRRASLFEFPLNAEEIFPRTGKDSAEYHKYLIDYFNMSQEHGSVFLTPFSLTAVEDRDSVVFLDHLVDDEYRVTFCRQDHFGENQAEIVTLAIGELNLKKPLESGGFLMPVAALYAFHTENGRRLPSILDSGEEGIQLLSNDLLTSAISYVEEVVYLMDPENFIIYKENNASKAQRKREARSGRKDILHKTVMRPHYVCLNEQETREFLLGQSKEPRPAHPVRGHWRRLMSPRYINKQGQRTYVRQYFTGQGRVLAHGGWNYEVMVKEGPTRIVPYERSTS